MLHTRAGRPSMRDLARGQRFSYTAVHNLFTKTIAEPPRLPLLLTVVEQLATLAPRMNVEATLDRFDALWRTADAEPFDESPQGPVEATALTARLPPGGKTATSGAPAGHELVEATADEQTSLERVSQHESPEHLRRTPEETSLEHDRRYKLGPGDGGRTAPIARIRELGELEPEGGAEEPPGTGPVGRAMTKELFFRRPAPRRCTMPRPSCAGPAIWCSDSPMISTGAGR